MRAPAGLTLLWQSPGASLPCQQPWASRQPPRAISPCPVTPQPAPSFCLALDGPLGAMSCPCLQSCPWPHLLRLLTGQLGCPWPWLSPSPCGGLLMDPSTLSSGWQPPLVGALLVRSPQAGPFCSPPCCRPCCNGRMSSSLSAGHRCAHLRSYKPGKINPAPPSVPSLVSWQGVVAVLCRDVRRRHPSSFSGREGGVEFAPRLCVTGCALLPPAGPVKY